MTYSGIDITNKGIPWKYEYIIDTFKFKTMYKHMTPFNINIGKVDQLQLGPWPIILGAGWSQPLHQN